MASFPRFLRLTGKSGGLIVPRRTLSYPKEPLTQALPGIAVPTSSQQRAVGRGNQGKTRITRLENGLRIASQQAFGQYSTIGVLVDAGSRYEVQYTSGISHFLQKLAFQSTSTFQSREHLMTELEQYGGMFDCQRFRDVMAYGLHVYSFALPQAMEVLSEALWRPRLTEEELEMERHSIRFENEDLENGPNAEPLLVELIHQAAYRDNTLGLPSLCPEDNISKVQSNDLRQFLASHYTPARMVLTGVNVDHDQFVELAQKHFVGAPTSWDGIEPVAVDESISQYTSGEVRISRSGPPVVGPNPLPDLAHIALALESSSYLEEDFFAFAVLNSLMGGGGSFSAGGPGKGMFTQLYLNVLTQHHWVYWALAQNHAYSDSGIFCLLGSAHPSKARELTEVLCQQFHSMAHAPNEVDLARAKQQLKSNLLMNLESRLIIFEDIGRQVLGQGKRYSAEELCQKIDAVTGVDLERVGQKMFESNPSLAVLGDLTHVPSHREVVEAFTNPRGLLPRRNKLFSFR